MRRASSTLLVRLLLGLCLVASALQGHVAQTHVHAAAVLSGSSASSGVDHADGQLPANSACLLCDIAGHTPAAAPLAATGQTALLELTGLPAPAGTAAPATATPSHYWRGRGPPPV